jgi:uncharacterized coiled-coil protein SlyX
VGAGEKAMDPMNPCPPDSQDALRAEVERLRAENDRLKELNAALKGERGVFARMAAKRDRLLEPMSAEEMQARADALTGKPVRND